MTIKSIKAREVLDSNKNPTVQAIIVTNKGTFKASVPSGTSTGKYEALEINTEKAVNNINKIIAPKLKYLSPKKQEEIDKMLINLDRTKNKSRLGANAILAVSMAVCRAGSAECNLPLYKHIQNLSGNKKLALPIPMILVFEGGKHAEKSSDIQEFMIILKTKTFRESLKIGTKIYNSIKKILKNKKLSTKLGLEGAYSPSLKNNEEYLDIIMEVIKLTNSKNTKIAIDVAASEFYKNKKYLIAHKKLDSKELSDYYKKLIKKYLIISIEDPFEQDDWNSWKSFNKKFGKKINIVGDDLTVTNQKRIQKAIDKKSCNAIIIKPNQIGTISESIGSAHLAQGAGWKIIVSHRSGETEDNFIADLAVGIGADFVKFGAPAKKERISKYNRLLRIEEELRI